MNNTQIADSLNVENGGGHSGENNIESKYKKIRCGDLEHQICILSNGDYALCCFDAEGMTHMNVKETPLMTAFYSKVFVNLRQKLLKLGTKDTICSTCSFVQ